MGLRGGAINPVENDRYILAIKLEFEALHKIQVAAQAMIFLYKTGAPEDYKAMLAELDEALKKYRDLKASAS